MIGHIRNSVEGTPPKWIAGAAIAAFITAAALLLFVFATGSTFGQRCAKVTKSGSPEWHQCVDDLSKGKNNI